MPRFSPFPGLRYDLNRLRLDEVICPPYDVIGPALRERLAARSPANAVHVELPEGGPERYEAAAALLQRWTEDGWLIPDPRPALYRYVMTTPEGRTSTSVIGALSVGDDDVLPHELTMRKAKTDRLDLLRATRTNLSPIWGLSLAAGLTAALGIAGDAAGIAVDDDGIRHELFRIDDAATTASVCAVVASAPLVIADGHHRYETARTYAEEASGADQIMCLVTELSEDQLTVGAIHRTISNTAVDIQDAFRTWFDEAPGALTLLTKDATWPITPTAAAYKAADSDLDSSVVALVLDALDSAETGHPHTVEEAKAAIEDGSAIAAVLLRPATVDQIAAWAAKRRLMPPKTTYFTPKPRTGMVFRSV